MKVITNETLIAKRKKLATRLSPLAMVLLLGGLATNIISLRDDTVSPLLFYATLTLLVLGFLMSTVATGLINRWVREPRADQHLTSALKGFDSRHALFNYTTKAPHILLAPNQLYAITTKFHDGQVSVKDNKWHRNFSLGRLLRIFADEGLGNPTVEARQNAKILEDLLKNNLPEAADIPVRPVIVFTDPKVDLTVENSDVPVLKGKQLKTFVREGAKGASIGVDTRKKIIALFSLSPKK